MSLNPDDEHYPEDWDRVNRAIASWIVPKLDNDTWENEFNGTDRQTAIFRLEALG